MSIVTRKKKVTIFFLFWLVLFVVIWSKMLVREPNGLYAGWVNIWGDWAAHLSYATSFGYGENLPPEMPLLIGAKFSYPFFADLVSGGLMRLGVDMVLAMLVPSLVLSMLLVAGLMFVGEKIVGSLKGGMVTTLLFLFNGGLGFWWWFRDIKEFGLLEVMKALPREYTHLEKLANIEWINIISSQVVPQRGFLMGFPIAVFIYWLLWKGFESKRESRKLLVAGLLTSTLPLIHAHSFVLVSWVAFWLVLMEVIKTKKITIQQVKKWIGFGVPVIILGIPQVLFFYGGSLGSEGFIRWQPGWMAEGNVLWFWIKNFGGSLILAIIGMKVAKSKLRKFSLPFWGMFLIANLWIFQPWEWDNSKVLTHWYLMACVLGAVTVTSGLKSKQILVKVLVSVGLVLSIWSGFLDTIRLTQYQNLRLRFFDNKELVLAEWVKKNTRRDSRFLTADNHDHWVPVLTGRKIVLGFKGWLWTYGLDYSIQEQAVGKMFEGGDQAKEWMRKYEVDYVVVGRLERERKINEEFFEDNFELVYELGGTKIFQVRNLEY
jgi:hypothetical protein